MKEVTIYTKATCPYCINAKLLLQNKGVMFNEIGILNISDEERAQLSAKTNGYRTVPQIFIGDTFIGGFDQLNKLNQEGKLDAMLA
ncbi:glutaredoxin 3 [Moraxella nasicaprae]|uniref:Glutaredoxin n=1 Tax=Moraxella nasicaprae TaxID=2904122 RepID=A0ABY6F5F5_9GAMM|nr:glutaredoxin 3 [Moraxella nasicaprae]UXZ05324.1 glutaredoxin 3 [Moraxella nasicaprae]